ncbi:MAG: tRNA (adenosine(37)-N6)-threonylcarbamoyltransferase complex dimerization subunit type 1 TsaB [Gemmatimonadota bacterium]|nr:tRNA (adenosine(37)-N6)-threonylcarbamoyltransferase complex dimerization subunit type 1 TsaB [Gemmatimonadota bacterium]
MNLLAIDTATDVPAVCLLGGDRSRARRLGWRSTFTETAPAIESLLAEAGLELADLDAIALPAGPGSFTGLRVGAALALGLAETRGIDLHAVPTLTAVAEAYAEPDRRRVCASLDARRGRRWAGVHERTDEGGWRRLSGPEDVVPEDVARIAGGAVVVGPDVSPGPERDRTPAEAIAALVAREPDRYRLESPGELRLIYVRPGVDEQAAEGAG